MGTSVSPWCQAVAAPGGAALEMALVAEAVAAVGVASLPEVGRCSSTLSKPVLKPPMVSALDTI
jgi:hypothetical protein